MLKRFIVISAALALLYISFLSVKMIMQEQDFLKGTSQEKVEEKPTHKIYNFTFTKYTSDGERELEIEGDSANIFSNIVNLNNVIAKAYAEESPVTITADNGVFDRSTSKVHLKKNVVATTDEGARLLSPSLDIDPPAKVVETEDEVEVKKENIDIMGTGAKGDSRLRQVKFHKNVTVVIQSEDAADPLGIDAKAKRKKTDKSGERSRTVITCDGPLDIDYENNIAHFYNNVIVVDKRGRLLADKMDVYYNDNRKGVQKIVAAGNVVIENPDGNTTYSDNVIYLAEEGRVILGGDPEAAYYPNSDFEKEYTPPTGRKETSHVAS
jgi:LPS export ABC transporter protein LptC